MKAHEPAGADADSPANCTAFNADTIPVRIHTMGTIKIMPCLDMKEGRVVKGVNFVNLRDAGDPAQNAAFYQAEGADELAMLDIAATLENRKTRLEWVRQVSSVDHHPPHGRRRDQRA